MALASNRSQPRECPQTKSWFWHFRPVMRSLRLFFESDYCLEQRADLYMMTRRNRKKPR
jgi:hypothetical protein